ncbi:twin-arginine translocase subunit TatC [Chitinophagaceae bacterium LB-8]|uniref:Sec-independent protein translocase protein TatC n=1 Tax=Paraflavisolibacter caeni TaxID=2982496 RepID=A0A9X2XYB9_9BACT|nr:twin-arginine translocase subunit TatC [Paraflavisolibacter caeni]MCU7551666.1 twin-arginine translocase subunit TatC [Paraflavisolibacter caeni]
MMALKFLNRNKQEETAEMSFIDHLEVLRGHLFRCVVAIAIGAGVVGYFNKFFIRNVLMGPTHPDFLTYVAMCKIGNRFGFGDALCIRDINIPMQNTVVGGQLSMFFSVILIGGLIIAFPFVFWEFWKFVKPALTKKELNKTRGVIFWVSFLFFTGVSFGYFVVAPYTINFFANFKIDENIENKWTIGSYLDTMTPLILGSGLAFQLPLVMYFLAKVGIVSATALKKGRKYALVIILVVAGVITPGPDIISQMTVALPLLLLYEISIILCRRVEKEEAKEELEWS